MSFVTTSLQMLRGWSILGGIELLEAVGEKLLFLVVLKERIPLPQRFVLRESLVEELEREMEGEGTVEIPV